MQMLVRKESPETLPASQRAALISLLADEDPAIYQMVRRKILSYGPVVCEWLHPQMLSSDPVMRRRALEIINHLARKGSDAKFLDFCLHNGEELDLELAVGPVFYNGITARRPLMLWKRIPTTYSAMLKQPDKHELTSSGRITRHAEVIHADV